MQFSISLHFPGRNVNSLDINVNHFRARVFGVFWQVGQGPRCLARDVPWSQRSLAPFTLHFLARVWTWMGLRRLPWSLSPPGKVSTASSSMPFFVRAEAVVGRALRFEPGADCFCKGLMRKHIEFVLRIQYVWLHCGYITLNMLLYSTTKFVFYVRVFLWLVELSYDNKHTIVLSSETK